MRYCGVCGRPYLETAPDYSYRCGLCHQKKTIQSILIEKKCVGCEAPYPKYLNLGDGTAICDECWGDRDKMPIYSCLEHPQRFDYVSIEVMLGAILSRAALKKRRLKPDEE